MNRISSLSLVKECTSKISAAEALQRANACLAKDDIANAAFWVRVAAEAAEEEAGFKSLAPTH